MALAKSDRNIIINLVENEQVHAQKSTRHLIPYIRLVLTCTYQELGDMCQALTSHPLTGNDELNALQACKLKIVYAQLFITVQS